MSGKRQLERLHAKDGMGVGVRGGERQEESSQGGQVRKGGVLVGGVVGGLTSMRCITFTIASCFSSDSPRNRKISPKAESSA